jgi:hypothetical protein
MTAHAMSLPNEAAIFGRSAIIRPFAGQDSLQPASGAPPLRTGGERPRDRADDHEGELEPERDRVDEVAARGQ